jgi:hypothetical protein
MMVNVMDVVVKKSGWSRGSANANFLHFLAAEESALSFLSFFFIQFSLA